MNTSERATALKYIDLYPITRFMDSRHIDYSRAAVKTETDIKVIFIGFDIISREILLASIINDQLPRICGDQILKKQVKYYILSPDDPNAAIKDYYNYERECLNISAQNRSAYFDLPDLPAQVEYIFADNQKYCDFLSKLLQSDGKSIPLIRVIISKDAYSNKLLNKVLTLIHALNATEYSCVFAVNDKNKLPDNVIRINPNEKGDCSVFERAAKERNRLYYEDSLGANASAELLRKACEAANNKWESADELMRESNIFSALGMRLKFNLLGLDLSSNDGISISETEYYSIYAKGDMPEIIKEYADGRKEIHYKLEYKPSLRFTLAYQEHMRWNAFMISRGYLPASKADCLDSTRGYGKSAELRIHRNLASFKGLIEYRRFIAENKFRENGGDINQLELQADVIKYDYQLMDDAFRVLKRLGKSIGRKE